MNRLTRLVPLSELIFAALVLATFATPNQPNAKASGAHVISFFAEHRTAERTGAVLATLAIVFLVFFAGYLYDRIRETDSRALGVVALVGASMAGVGLLVSASTTWVLTDGPTHDSPSGAQVINALGYDTVLPIIAHLVVFAIATGIAVLRERWLPAWLGWTLIAFGLISASPLFAVGLIGVVVWSAVVAVVAVARDRNPREPTSKARQRDEVPAGDGGRARGGGSARVARHGVGDGGADAVHYHRSAAGLYGAERRAARGRGRGGWLGQEHGPATSRFARYLRRGRDASGLSGNQAGRDAVCRGGTERHSRGRADFRRRWRGRRSATGGPGLWHRRHERPLQRSVGGIGRWGQRHSHVFRARRQLLWRWNLSRLAADRRGGRRRRGRPGPGRQRCRLRQPRRPRRGGTEWAASFGQLVGSRGDQNRRRDRDPGLRRWQSGFGDDGRWLYQRRDGNDRGGRRRRADRVHRWNATEHGVLLRQRRRQLRFGV
jgi:hypothetical protein